MKIKFFTISKAILALVLLTICVSIDAQVRYDSNNRLTIGNIEPFAFYNQTFYSNGIYLKCKTNNFFQIDATPAATRLASHYDQVIFYNTQSGIYNSIQVKNVYNYSDAKAKSNVESLNNGLDYVLKLRPVSYEFSDKSDKTMFRKGGNGKEIGLLAQEVEAVLPNIVLTDPDGNKLINYTAIIPIMIDAIKALQKEVEELKSK